MKKFAEYMEEAAFLEGKTTDAGIKTIANEMEYPFPKAKKIWKKVYRNALKQYGDEGRAIATAHSALKTIIAAKKKK
jgi:hypothetical protein